VTVPEEYSTKLIVQEKKKVGRISKASGALNVE